MDTDGLAGQPDENPDRPPEDRPAREPDDYRAARQDLAQDPDLMHLIEHALSGNFRYEEGSDPYIRVGTAAVYAGGHEFDDDDIAWAGGSDIPLRSGYPAMVEIRDTDGDQQRQQVIAGRVFDALRSAGRWRAVFIDDMQKVLDSYQPAR